MDRPTNHLHLREQHLCGHEELNRDAWYHFRQFEQQHLPGLVQFQLTQSQYQPLLTCLR
jgi:hypothetical protein